MLEKDNGLSLITEIEGLQVRQITIFQPYPDKDSIQAKISELADPGNSKLEDQDLLQYLNQLKITPLNPRERNLSEQVDLIGQCVTDRVEFIGELYNLSLVKTDESDTENNRDSQLKQIGYQMGFIYDKDNTTVTRKFLEIIKPIIQTESDRAKIFSGFKENTFLSKFEGGKN